MRIGIAGLFATVVLGVSSAIVAVAAEPTPVPDVACASEASFRSTSGTTKASLLVINNTSETLQSLWLDYAGKRVFYQQVAPLTSYLQQTFLTHPWIIASLQGTCYRFVVMNSVAQTVTVDPGSGPPSILAKPPTSTPSVASATAGASPQATAVAGAAATTGANQTGSGFPTLLVAGAAAAVAIAAAALWAWNLALHGGKIRRPR
jgi:hypothetical protein